MLSKLWRARREQCVSEDNIGVQITSKESRQKSGTGGKECSVYGSGLLLGGGVDIGDITEIKCEKYFCLGSSGRMASIHFRNFHTNILCKLLEISFCTSRILLWDGKGLKPLSD